MQCSDAKRDWGWAGSVGCTVAAGDLFGSRLISAAAQS